MKKIKAIIAWEDWMLDFKWFGVLIAFTAIVLLGASVSMAHAEEAAEEKKAILTGTLEFGAYNKYVGVTSGATDYNHSVAQPAIGLSHEPTGIYVKLWDSYSPHGHQDSGDEVDYIIGITRDIKGFKVDFGYAYYDLAMIGHSKGDLHAIYLNVDKPSVLTITPFIPLERDIPVNKEVLDGGMLWRIGIKRDVDVFKQAFNLNLSVAGNDGAYGTRPELVSSARFTVATTVNIYGGLTVTPSINFQKNLGYSVANGGLTQNKIYGGFLFSWSFDIIK